MSDETSQFQRLIDLAKEPSSEKRRELLRQVTDLFLDKAPTYSETERDHFGAILGSVARDMDVAVREHLAKQFAGVASAPHDFIHQLANDEYSVAKDVLEKSTVLSDADLLAIARSKSQDKLEAIAARPALSETISAALVEHGNDAVVVRLVTNPGAKVSRPTFQHIVDRSQTCEILQGPLVQRTDLPPDMLQDMFMFVSSELRAKITQKLDTFPPDVLDKAFAEAARNFSAELRLKKETDRRAMAYVREMVRRKELNEQLLHQLLRSKQQPEFVHAFAKLADVDVQTVRRTLDTRNTEGLAIICKSARFDRTTFSAIVLLLDQSTKRTAQQTNEMLALYDKVTPESAQRVMRFWRVRKEATEAPIALAQAV
jgi:uncharacterized protein (DUF2336 family)